MVSDKPTIIHIQTVVPLNPPPFLFCFSQKKNELTVFFPEVLFRCGLGGAIDERTTPTPTLEAVEGSVELRRESCPFSGQLLRDAVERIVEFGLGPFEEQTVLYG